MDEAGAEKKKGCGHCNEGQYMLRAHALFAFRKAGADMHTDGAGYINANPAVDTLSL